MIADPKGPPAVDPWLRRRFWSRLCMLGIVHGPELVRVHRLAQARRIAPEEALVLLGMLTRDQVVEFLVGEAPVGFRFEGVAGS